MIHCLKSWKFSFIIRVRLGRAWIRQLDNLTEWIMRIQNNIEWTTQNCEWWWLNIQYRTPFHIKWYNFIIISYNKYVLVCRWILLNVNIEQNDDLPSAFKISFSVAVIWIAFNLSRVCVDTFDVVESLILIIAAFIIVRIFSTSPNHFLFKSFRLYCSKRRLKWCSVKRLSLSVNSPKFR